MKNTNAVTIAVVSEREREIERELYFTKTGNSFIKHRLERDSSKNL